MVGTIAPVGDRARTAMQLSRFASGSLLFGSVIGAVATSLVLGGIGELLLSSFEIERVARLLIAMVVLVAIMYELRMIRLPLPSLPRQVPVAWWGRYDRRVTAFLWGLQLGAGVLTYITWAGVYVMLTLIVVIGLPGGIIIGACYGIVRRVQPLIARGMAYAKNWDDRLMVGGSADVVLASTFRNVGLVGLLTFGGYLTIAGV